MKRKIKTLRAIILGLTLGAVLAWPLHGCGDSSQPVSASRGFSWIIPGELAAMPVPGKERPLDQDVTFLEQEGIRVLISLTEQPADRAVLSSHAIIQEHIPVEDFHPPTQEQMLEFVSVVETSVAAGKPVGVHCTAGLGRSGTMVAAYLVSRGASSSEAMATIREKRPGSIETPEQEAAVAEFARTLAQSK